MKEEDTHLELELKAIFNLHLQTFCLRFLLRVSVATLLNTTKRLSDKTLKRMRPSGSFSRVRRTMAVRCSKLFRHDYEIQYWYLTANETYSTANSN